MCIFQKKLVVFTVEYCNKRICKGPDQCDHDDFYCCCAGQCPAEKFFYIARCTFAEAFADQRLRALCHTVHDRHSHKREVCYYSICSNSGASSKSKDQHIKYERDHCGGNFAHKRGHAKLTTGDQMPHRQFFPFETDVAFFAEIMRGTYQHRNTRTKSSCQRRTGKSKPCRENKNVIKHDIEGTAGKGTCHYG